MVFSSAPAVSVALLVSLLWPGDALACAACGCGDPTLTTMGAEKPYAGRMRLALEVSHLTLELGRPETGGLELSEQRFDGIVAYAPGTDLGYVVRIDRAAITVGAIEIVPCEGATASFTSAARWLDDARSWSLVRTAHAHTESSAVRIGTPHVLDLTAPSGALRLGTLEPPLGSYCGLNVVLAPADADAEGLPAETDMVGWTLAVEGSIEEPGGAVIALAARDAGARPISLSFEPAMAVDADARLTILLEVQVAASLDGIDFASIDDEEQGAAILSRLRVVAHAAP